MPIPDEQGPHPDTRLRLGPESVGLPVTRKWVSPAAVMVRMVEVVSFIAKSQGQVKGVV